MQPDLRIPSAAVILDFCLFFQWFSIKYHMYGNRRQSGKNQSKQNLRFLCWESSHCCAVEMNPINSHKDVDSIPGLGPWVVVWVTRRWGSDCMLLRLWRRLAGLAPNGPLTWELPYASGVALKRKKENYVEKWITTGTLPQKPLAWFIPIYLKSLNRSLPISI